MVYRIRWRARLVSENTLETIQHLPTRPVVKYYDKKHLLHPNKINEEYVLKRETTILY